MRVPQALAALVLIIVCGLTNVAHARKWKVRPSDLASDYAQIVDQRSATEIVLIFWMAPEAIDDRVTNVDMIRAVLREYMVVGVAHGNVSPLGRIDFKTPDGVVVQSADNNPVQVLSKESLPPTAIGLLTALQAFFAQSLGHIGQGFHWFIFDGKRVDSCRKGSFLISYAGERYNYDTPIPGCA